MVFLGVRSAYRLAHDEKLAIQTNSSDRKHGESFGIPFGKLMYHLR
jgi:hypothetical protein